VLSFRITARDGAARRGVISTPHGEVDTPGFFAVATRGALKGLDPEPARATGVQALIVNAYHLHLQPGGESLARLGGLHGYLGWPGALATDSGGFQAFSFRHGQVADEIKGRRRTAKDEESAEAVKVDDDGVEFRSYLDGARQRFTPESSMALQRDLGADLLMALDECTPFHVPAKYTEQATDRNARWAARCRTEFERLGMAAGQALYGIVHGGVYPELRRRSALAVTGIGFDGYAIGDCLGQTKSDWYGIVDQVTPLLPEDRPRHLLGVGEPDDLVEGALRGVDTFDCAMPTRVARHGHALHPGLPRFRLDLTAAAMRDDPRPPLEGCDCRTCARFTRAYLWHLFHAHEMLAISLTVEHNLRYTARLLERVREAISSGTLLREKEALLSTA